MWFVNCILGRHLYCFICDAIKVNESELKKKVKKKLCSLYAPTSELYHTETASKVSIRFQRDITILVIFKTIKYKCYYWLYLQINISEFLTHFAWSHHIYVSVQIQIMLIHMFLYWGTEIVGFYSNDCFTVM